MVQGQVFLKRGVALLLFNFFKVYHFYSLKLFYSLQNCGIHLKKNYFFCQHNFMEKVIQNCLKMSVCLCVNKVGVSDWNRRGVFYLRVGEIVWNILRVGGIEKTEEDKNFKRGGGGKLRWGVVALKKERCNPLMNYVLFRKSFNM